MYGRCILSQDCYILAFRSSNTNLEFKDNPAGYLEYKSQDQIGAKYFGTSKPTFSGRSEGKKFYVTGEIEVRHNAMGSFFLKPQDGWDVKATLWAKRRVYSKHIRLFTRLRDIGENLFSDG